MRASREWSRWRYRAESAAVQRFSVCIADFELGRTAANALDLAVRRGIHRAIGMRLEQRELDARRPGIDDEDRLPHRPLSLLHSLGKRRIGSDVDHEFQ
jgi:hypothetical protein